MRDDEAPAPQIGARLGNKVTVTRWRGHHHYKWRASFIEGGVHKRKGFTTKKAAQKWAAKRTPEALKHGTEATLTAAERAAIIETRSALAGLEIPLRTALDFAIRHFEEASKSATVARVYDEFIAARKRAGKSLRYLTDLEHRLGRFKETFGDRSIATIGRDEISDWLHGLKLSPTSINNYLRVLVVMFNDAIDGGYLTENPAAKVNKSKVIETEIGILTPEQTSTLLKKAAADIVPAIAIGAFAGVRAAELERLDWSDISLSQGHLQVRAKAAKSARRRLIPLAVNLKAWLKPHERPENPIWPLNGRKLFEAAKRTAGFGKPGSETDEEKKKGVSLVSWPNNALRHSFASYHLAQHQNAHELALQLGHTDTKIIFAHYRELVTPKQAAAYWKICPEEAGDAATISVPGEVSVS